MMHADPYEKSAKSAPSRPTLLGSIARVLDALLEARELAQIVCEDVTGLIDRDADKKMQPVAVPVECALGEAERLCALADDVVRLVRNAGIALGCPRMSVKKESAAPAMEGRRL